jgi:hypothetical protein
MATYFPDASELTLLTHLLKTTSPPALTLRLFQSNTTASSSTVVSDLTEANFDGYSAAVLTRSSWGDPSTVSGSAVATYGTATTWTCGATGNTIYGFYLTENTSDSLVYVERFSTARVLTEGVDLSVTPKISLTNNDA